MDINSCKVFFSIMDFIQDVELTPQRDGHHTRHAHRGTGYSNGKQCRVWQLECEFDHTHIKLNIGYRKWAELSVGRCEEWGGRVLRCGHGYGGENAGFVAILGRLNGGCMRQLKLQCHCFVLGSTTDEADWTDNDVIIRVRVQSHRGANTNFDLFVLGCLPVLRGDSKENVVRFAVELALLCTQLLTLERMNEVEIGWWLIHCEGVECGFVRGTEIYCTFMSMRTVYMYTLYVQYICYNMHIG